MPLPGPKRILEEVRMKITKFFYGGVLSVLIACSWAFSADSVTIDGPLGKIEVMESHPTGFQEGKGPFPLLVITPGKNYAVTGTIFEDLARGAVEGGYFVARFNWGYIAKNQNPSKDFKAEKDELEAVVQYYLKKPYVMQSKVVVASKSMGTQVMMTSESALKKAKGLLLITPNCDPKNPFEKTYKPLFNYIGKMLISISVNDPYCDIRELYDSLPKFGYNFHIQTVGGDHNFEFLSNDALSKENRATAIRGMVNWLKLIL